MCGPNCMRPPSRLIIGPGPCVPDLVYGPGCFGPLRPRYDDSNLVERLLRELAERREWDEENRRNVGEGSL